VLRGRFRHEGSGDYKKDHKQAVALNFDIKIAEKFLLFDKNL
jgi:hypothetical protein